MNRSTLERLKKNPHYKVSAKNYSQLEEDEREPMIEFGRVPNNQSGIQKHPTSPIRAIRRGINAQTS